MCFVLLVQTNAISLTESDRIDSLQRASMKFFNKSFEEEPNDQHLRSVDIALLGNPIQGFLQGTFYLNGNCEEDTDLDFFGVRLNTCIHDLADPRDKEQAFVIYSHLFDNQVLGYRQSYTDASCTKKHGKPRKWKTPVGICLPGGVRYEINAGLSKANQDIGIATVIFKTQKGCRASNMDGVLVYQGFPFHRCQSGFNDLEYTSCSSDSYEYRSFDSSDGTCSCPDVEDDVHYHYGDCVEGGTPHSMVKVDCSSIRRTGSWLKDVCI